jgi:putative nucleotidyltransferase with HDIG domain
MKESNAVFAEVSRLYLADSAKSMGKWMWHNHVQWVAAKAKKLAEKYGADPKKVYCAALLHDLGDSRHDRSYKEFAAWSEKKGREILLLAGFDEADAKEIIEIIIRPHSCRPGNLPTTQEGKVLATADAMWHLQTGFFPMICYMHRPEHTDTYEAWQEWFSEKIERDFGPKIFFADERAEVTEDYEALCRVFGNKTLHSTEG